jgi:magnesium transporter
VISALLYDRASKTLKTLNDAEVMASKPQPIPEEAHPDSQPRQVQGGFAHTVPHCNAGELLWLDITDPDEHDYELLQKRFSLHAMVLEDIKAREGRPKIHDYRDYLYVIFHALSWRTPDPDEDDERTGELIESEERSALHMCEIDCLIGPDYVVTLHPEPLTPLDDLRTRWQRNPQMMDSGASYLLYEIMDEILDDYFPLLDQLDDQIGGFEDRLFMEFQETLSADIFSLKRCLLQVRRVAGPTRDVVNLLLRRDADSGGKHFAYFQDLYDHTNRIVDMVDTFRDLLSGALDAYLAMASNRMNAIMKTLTSASIILLVPTLIAGIYGMNFEKMPELHSHYGYPMALGVMFTSILGLTLYFRRKKWL